VLVLVLVLVDRFMDDDAESHSFLNSIAIIIQLNSTQNRVS